MPRSSRSASRRIEVPPRPGFMGPPPRDHHERPPPVHPAKQNAPSHATAGPRHTGGHNATCSRPTSAIAGGTKCPDEPTSSQAAAPIPATPTRISPGRIQPVRLAGSNVAGIMDRAAGRKATDQRIPTHRPIARIGCTMERSALPPEKWREKNGRTNAATSNEPAYAIHDDAALHAKTSSRTCETCSGRCPIPTPANIRPFNTALPSAASRSSDHADT